jgi:hypothetical protein
MAITLTGQESSVLANIAFNPHGSYADGLRLTLNGDALEIAKAISGKECLWRKDIYDAALALIGWAESIKRK